MLKLFISALFWGLAINASAQSKDPISVRLEVLGKGIPDDVPSCYPDIKENSYLVKLEVTNNGDTTLPITFWNCSWYWNWKSSNDSACMVAWGCDGNFPEPVKVPANYSLVFYAGLYVKPSMKGKEIKMGFGNGWKDFVDKYDFAKTIQPEGKLYWSNSIIVKGSYPVVNNYFRNVFVVRSRTEFAANLTSSGVVH